MHPGFRTIEISGTRFAFDGLSFVTVKSDALKGRGDITVWLPPHVESLEELPLVLLLHGVYGSHWAWALSGGAHKAAARLIAERSIRPMALVMPSDGLWGDGSGYVKHAGRDYERWIAEDVPAAARLLLPYALRPNTPLLIGGLSMGGFGALRLGAKYGRTKFRAISAHSSITHFHQMSLFVEEPLENYGARPEDESVIETILSNPGELPALRFDCGVSDPLIDENRSLHRALLEAGVEHTYEKFGGGHEWTYWEEHVADSLRFFETALRREM
jgi:putative tributyrin esterase